MNNLSIRKMNGLSTKKKKGFTLVELIIVIAIIAILAAIAIPKFGSITRNANIKSDIANAKNLHGIAAQVIADNGTVTDTTVAAKVDGGAYPIPKATSGHFFVTVDGNNDITVSVGASSATATQVYPHPSGIYAS